MSTLNLSKLTFTKKDLLATASEQEVVFMILSSCLLQETVFLHKLIIFSIQKNDQTETSRAAVAQGMYLLRNLGAHLFESWETLRKDSYRAINSKFDAKLSEQGKKTLADLRNYFSNSGNLCEKLRNEHAYHRDPRRTLGLLRQIANDSVLDVLVHDSYANCRFTAFEMMASLSALGTADISKLKEALDALMKDVVKTAEWFMTLLTEYVVMFFEQVPNLVREEIKLTGVPSLDSVWFPFYVVRNESVAAASTGAEHPSTSSG